MSDRRSILASVHAVGNGQDRGMREPLVRYRVYTNRLSDRTAPFLFREVSPASEHPTPCGQVASCATDSPTDGCAVGASESRERELRIRGSVLFASNFRTVTF